MIAAYHFELYTHKDYFIYLKYDFCSADDEILAVAYGAICRSLKIVILLNIAGDRGIVVDAVISAIVGCGKLVLSSGDVESDFVHPVSARCACWCGISDFDHGTT